MIEDYQPKNYYVSLVGYYLKFSEEIVRKHLLEYWCSVYSEQDFKSSRYYTQADAPIKLYNHWD